MPLTVIEIKMQKIYLRKNHLFVNSRISQGIPIYEMAMKFQVLHDDGYTVVDKKFLKYSR